MPKIVLKPLTRVATAVATGGVSEVVRAGQALAKGDIIGAVSGAAGGIGVASAVGAGGQEVRSAVTPLQAKAGAALPGEDPALQAEREQSAIDNTKLEERRRRQLLARQGDLVKTSPLGAAIKQNKLGGPSLTGY